jgi:hypothetical protein
MILPVAGFLIIFFFQKMPFACLCMKFLEMDGGARFNYKPRANRIAFVGVEFEETIIKIQLRTSTSASTAHHFEQARCKISRHWLTCAKWPADGGANTNSPKHASRQLKIMLVSR